MPRNLQRQSLLLAVHRNLLNQPDQAREVGCNQKAPRGSESSQESGPTWGRHAAPTPRRGEWTLFWRKQKKSAYRRPYPCAQWTASTACRGQRPSPPFVPAVDLPSTPRSQACASRATSLSPFGQAARLLSLHLYVRVFALVGHGGIIALHERRSYEEPV